MRENIDHRFEVYCEEISEALDHADRRAPARWYLNGLIRPGERKSVEPMAARLCLDNVAFGTPTALPSLCCFNVITMCRAAAA